MDSPLLSSKCYAVSIGINHYQPSAALSALTCAENDAKAIDDLLATLQIPQENHALLLGKEATLEAINNALDHYLLDLPGEDDFVLLYFAGHSCPLIPYNQEETPGEKKESEVFLASYDFDASKIKRTPSLWQNRALRMGRIRQTYFEQGSSRRRLFLFDSCFSGDFYGPKYRGETEPIREYLHSVFGSSVGRIALSSCLPNQKAREDAVLGHGLFTYYLLEALQGHAPKEFYPRGYLNVGSLLDYLERMLPKNQCPVRSGVEHGSFKIGYYPQFASNAHQEQVSEPKNGQADRQMRLHALLHHHESFLRDRLDSFVGRKKELEEIHQRIEGKKTTGGYVTITGQAGQGKSSIIAKLVEEYAPENVAYHFIPFNPGPDHQVGLLRNLMARLILKYDLSDLYVAAENRAALRDYFPNVLKEVVAKGGQEVIFIDGLDQIEEDMNGVRDLSFLPDNPPEGIAFVLGTRPNDTLQPLELLKPHYQYSLPNLSRSDFNLILEHRGVILPKYLADQFYTMMQENALYLDLVAKELRENTQLSPQEMITHIASNPDNLFSLTITRLKRKPVEWRGAIKPVLGILLTAREPISFWHIRQILHVEDDQLRDGIARLGGLIRETTQRRYSLFHLKLQDYLRQDEQRPSKEYVFAADEEEHWHAELVTWCEREPNASMWLEGKDIQEQGRREYARHHYIAHLYLSKEYPKLFSVLNEGSYGRAKERYDRSSHSYIQDLDLGRRASIVSGKSFEERLSYLPLLWRYTLLEGSLRSQGDQYPETLFQTMLLLGKEIEVLGLIELITRKQTKVQVLLQLALHLDQQPTRQQESMQLFLRAASIAQQIEWRDEKATTLCEIAFVLAQARQWERAEEVAEQIERSYEKAKALSMIASVLAEAEQWEGASQLLERAEEVAEQIEGHSEKEKALGMMAAMWTEAKQWERAEEVAEQIEGRDEKAKTLGMIAAALAEAKQWERAEEIVERAEKLADQIEWGYRKIEALSEIALALAKAEQWNRAEEVAKRAEDVAREIEYSYEKAETLSEIAVVLAEAEQWERASQLLERAEEVAEQIERRYQKAEVLREIAIAFVKGKQWERASQFLERAEKVAEQIEYSEQKAVVLRKIATVLAEMKQWERAEEVAEQIERRYQKVLSLSNIAVVLAEAEQWERASQLLERAEKVAGQIERSYEKATSLHRIALALAKAEQWERAEKVAGQIEERDEKVKTLGMMAAVLTEVEQWERANQFLERAEEVAEQIEGNYEKAVALSEIASAFVKGKQWERANQFLERAEKLAEQIEQGSQKAKVLSKLAAVLAKAGQWERAQKVAEQIEEGYQKLSAISAIAAELAKVEQWNVMLHLIETAWLLVSTRRFAFQFLSLVYPFIIQYPWLQEEIFKALQWTEEFLKDKDDIAF